MTSLLDTLSLLTPYDINIAKARIGPETDGGYIVADRLSPSQSVLSYGIATEFQFDETLARAGHKIFMFDHTIEQPVLPHETMRWFKEGVSGISDPSQSLYSVHDHLARHGIDGDALILKMDVEGAEFDAIGTMPDETLLRFEQILIEVHYLANLANPTFRALCDRMLRKLNKHFTLFHVHANNCDGPDGLAIVNGVPVSNLLELSYIRTSLVKRTTSRTLYPTALDFPNLHPRDKLLWFYPFLPTPLKKSAFTACEDRVSEQAAASPLVTVTSGAAEPRNGAERPAEPMRLVNIAVGKAATQSSLSPWSQPGEAARAITGEIPEYFAFHTGEDDGPWWQVDLGASHAIETIVVHNRRDDFQKRASTLTVEIAEADGRWVLVHKGLVVFGSAGRGEPLRLPLGSMVRGRYVRLSLVGREYLHLSQVEVLARPDRLGLDEFAGRFGLDQFCSRPFDFGHAYSLVGADPLSNAVVGLKIDGCGRFGNACIQYTHMIALAKRTGLRYIQLGAHEMMDVTAPFEADGLIFLPKDMPLPRDGLFLTGGFFDSTTFAPVLAPFMRFAPGDEALYTEVGQRFLRPHMLSGIPLPNESHPEDEVTIHIRSGDLFEPDRIVDRTYRQPPLAFYTLAVKRLLQMGLISRARLIYEDRGNPCIEALEAWLESHGIAYRTQAGTLQEDLSALIDAPHLVFGYGTFGYAACRVSTRIKTLHYFEPELGGRYGEISIIDRVFAVSDAAGHYIKPLVWGTDQKGNWTNSPEQRAMMVTYPEEWLLVEEKSADRPGLQAADRLSGAA